MQTKVLSSKNIVKPPPHRNIPLGLKQTALEPSKTYIETSILSFDYNIVSTFYLCQHHFLLNWLYNNTLKDTQDRTITIYKITKRENHHPRYSAFLKETNTQLDISDTTQIGTKQPYKTKLYD